ncbi:MAG: hypothetical protein WBP79_11595 [Candidatus Acidiferrales bacterium]
MKRGGEIQERGFTAVEVVIVLLIVMTIMAMATIQLQPTIQQFRANAGMAQVKGALRQARELAISERRSIVVKFIGNNTVQLFLVNINAGGVQVVAAAPFLSLPIEGTVTFMTFGGETDTPDGYGFQGPVAFNGIAGGPAVMMFQSDGTFTDGNGNPINGSVFLGVLGVPTSARAVTVLGATGRVHTYHATPTGWTP